MPYEDDGDRGRRKILLQPSRCHIHPDGSLFEKAPYRFPETASLVQGVRGIYKMNLTLPLVPSAMVGKVVGWLKK